MPSLFLAVIIVYFASLILISKLTSKGADNASFFNGNRQSPWYLVAFGMIGASLSGVTFISVPGWVGDSSFSYFQLVLGYFPGYMVVAFVLLPLYYRLNLTSIYSYLGERFGKYTYKTGASYFLISRMIGSALRLFLVAIVLQTAVFEPMKLEIPFWLTVFITIALIWVYTFKGGIKTIVFTDTLQTFFLLAAAIIAFFSLKSVLLPDGGSVFSLIAQSDYSQIFYFDNPKDGKYFFKQFFAGMFITIAMTGLDQDMMQKNLTCRNLKDAQKNMVVFSVVLLLVNLLFLGLGSLLFLYANKEGISVPSQTDYLFPQIALGGTLGPLVGILFVVGLIASAYSSADSALTALTTSFCYDILGINGKSESQIKKTRMLVHVGVSLVMMLVIIAFKELNNDNVISSLFTITGYTYGPLLGIYAFGLITKTSVKDYLVPVLCIASPLVSYFLKDWLFNAFEYKVSFELLIINALITMLGLWLLKNKKAPLIA